MSEEEKEVIGKVRLTPRQVAAIRESFSKTFGREDRLWIFGSRADLSKKGGDLDFYVETGEKNTGKAVDKKTAFIVALWRTIGEQKIDVVLNILSLGDTLPIYNIAKTTGVRLV